MSSSASSRAMLRVLRRMSASRSAVAAAWEPAPASTIPGAASTSTSTSLCSFARSSSLQQQILSSSTLPARTWSSSASSSLISPSAAAPLQQQHQHRRAIATTSAPTSAAAAPDPPLPPSKEQQQGPQHSPLQAFVPQIPFDDDELEQLGGDGGGGGGDDFAADALARRRARRRAALAARGELPRGACRRENLPLSWKKLDLAIKLVRRRPVDDALAQLAAVPRKSARLLRAAVANAAANAVDAGGDPSRLVVERVWATKGRYTKRLWIMGRGYSSARETRRSHLNVEVTEAPEGAEFLEVNGARRGRRGTGAREQRQQAPAPPALAAMGDAAARDAARQLDLARKRRFESARFVAPAAMARLARSRGSAVTTTTTTV